MKNTLTILLSLLTFSVQGQISESWNLTVDTYTHNPSTYAPNNPPIEIVKFSNSDKVILTQNGTLIKINSKREILWRKEISVCARQRIIVDKSDNVIFSCGSEITKFDLNGKLLWNRDYSSSFNKNYLTFDALTSDNGKIYLVGHFFYSKHICQLSIDSNGNVLWKTKFRQDVDYEFSFLPPKQIILNDGIIYILAHDTNYNSFLYSSNLKGKNRKEIQVDYKIKKLKSKDRSLFALGHLGTSKDTLIFSKLDTKLNFLEKYEFALPRNFDYKKAMRSWSTVHPTKEEFDKENITAYAVNDFEFLNAQNIIVVGNSYGKPWIANVDLNKEIVWNWDKKDSRYFNFNNEYSQHYFSLYSVDQIGNRFLISGICDENDHEEGGFNTYVNIFMREIDLQK